MPSILMCPPKFYGIEYEINPWMSRLRGADVSVAEKQWNRLHDVLKNDCGAAIELVNPQEGLPDLVFTANAGLIDEKKVVISRFKFPARSGEEPIFKKWFSDHGFETFEMPEDVFFEGAGDALFSGDQLFCGYHFRSDMKSHEIVGDFLGRHVLSVQLNNPRFYHLDTCFCPLKPGCAIYYPGAFDEYANKVFQANINDLIPVVEEEAGKFGCNSVCVGDHVVVPSGCPKLNAELAGRGYQVHSVQMTEYLKSGGAAKCLTLRLDANHP